MADDGRAVMGAVAGAGKGTDMSKASEWAKRQPKELHLRNMEGPFTTLVFPVVENGQPAMRIDNSGPFSRRESLKLAKWILDMFSAPSAAPKGAR